MRLQNFNTEFIYIKFIQTQFIYKFDKLMIITKATISKFCLLASILFVAGCNESTSSAPTTSEEKNPTLYSSVTRMQCKDSLESAKDSKIYLDRNNPNDAVYIGDCAGCTNLTLSIRDFCEISADVALNITQDTLFISYANIQSKSECTCYRSLTFKVPNKIEYKYVKFKDKVFNLVPSNMLISCLPVEYKEGYCIHQ